MSRCFTSSESSIQKNEIDQTTGRKTNFRKIFTAICALNLQQVLSDIDVNMKFPHLVGSKHRLKYIKDHERKCQFKTIAETEAT